MFHSDGVIVIYSTLYYFISRVGSHGILPCLSVNHTPPPQMTGTMSQKALQVVSDVVNFKIILGEHATRSLL